MTRSDDRSLMVVMLYKLHTARTCRIANPFDTSNPSAIARSRKGRCNGRP